MTKDYILENKLSCSANKHADRDSIILKINNIFGGAVVFHFADGCFYGFG